MNDGRDYPNSGILFTNHRKKKDTDPDSTGRADNIICPHCNQRGDFWLNGWNKLARDGSTFQSLSFKAKTEAPPTAEATQTAAPRKRDSDVPF
jgi:hypothetical protein